jgi:hypothetical protein
LRWTAWITGGYLVAVTTALPYYGVTLDPSINRVVVGFGLAASLFMVWNQEVNRAETAGCRIRELEGRPDLTLKHELFKPTMNDPPEWGAGSGQMMHRFVVRNGGTVQAVNVSIEEIPLPMSKFVKKSMAEETEAFEAQTGEKVGERQPGWDVWIIRFDTLTNIGVGEELPLRFNIENMGPLQSRDICYCLGSTVREGLGPHSVPLTLRFSNRDGSTWLQEYDLEHRFKCNISLTFKEVELVSPANASA